MIKINKLRLRKLDNRSILSYRSDFHQINSLSISFYTLLTRMLISLSIDEMLLPRYVYWSANFRGLSIRVKMALFLV